MDDQIEAKPYSPEPGSALHEIVKTERLGEMQDQETEEQRKQEKLDDQMYEMDREEEIRELEMGWTHIDRVRAGDIAEGYGDKSFDEINNEAYHVWHHKFKEGDRRPSGDVYSEFYSNVYPKYPAYLAQRRQEDPNVSTKTVVEDFLRGVDLRKKQ